jgi:hypothetical protein
MNALVVEQLRAYLTDERLSSEISLSKFIQALQIIFRNSQKFTNVSLDEWSKLIAKNRGKVNVEISIDFFTLFVLDLSQRCTM